MFNLYFVDVVDPDTGVDPASRKALLPEDASALFAANSPLWPQGEHSGILPEELKDACLKKQQESFNDWVVALAKVGFHLFNEISLPQTDHSSAA
ncbi:MAG: hypothetical protein HC929_13415 [Leptolyngbyaceae cyanobacterium SM2_5_2]|nr:hypothetical protein [Leptolyngbyaceae cyanobacterium SM2_5_2]